jgi:AraC family transcriptional regulator
MRESKFQINSMLQFPDFSGKGFDIGKYNSRFLHSNYIIHVNSSQASFPTHWGSLAIKCAFHGAEFYEVKNGVFAADQDKFLILNNGTHYSSWIDSAHDVESLAISFSPTFENEVISTLKLNHNVLLDDPAQRVNTEFRFMERLYSYSEPIKALIYQIRNISCDVSENKRQLEELYYQLMENMVQLQADTKFEVAAIQKLKQTTKVELFARLMRARDFIYSCYNEDLTLAKIAQIACLNEYYFLREFKRAYGITPHQYLTQRRIEIAASMLRARHCSITEICHLVGFSDPASFSKLFKRLHGHSPIEFRKSADRRRLV